MEKNQKSLVFVHFVQVKCVRFWESGLYLNWLLPVQVLRFTFGSRDSPKTLLHLGYVFQSIPNLTGRSYFN